MKKLARLFTVILLAAAMVLGLACCGEKGSEEASAPAAESTAETKEETSEETTEEETKLEGKELLKYYANEFLRITDGKELNKYDDAVAAYEQACKDKGKIIFFGSSHFTRWKKSYDMVRELEEDILSESGEQVCLNHGIGGSNIAHNIYYYKRMVKNYEPKALALSVLFNYSSDYNFTQEEVMLMIEYFLEMARQDFPGIQFYLIVDHTKDTKKVINGLLDAYVTEHDDTHLVELNFEERYAADTEGHPGSTDFQKDVYLEDNVHYTVLGYKYYAQIWREALKEELK